MHEQDQKAAFDMLSADQPKRSSFLQEWAAKNSGPPDIEYVKAFERSCPGVRMTTEERQELRRLFYEALRQWR